MGDAQELLMTPRPRLAVLASHEHHGESATRRAGGPHEPRPALQGPEPTLFTFLPPARAARAD